MKIRFSLILFLSFILPASAQRQDTLQVLFPLDKSYLTDEASHMLDSFIKNNILERGKKMIILGFGDYLGTEAYNESLSYARARNVEDFLLLSGFSKQDIKLVIGKGKINRPPVNGKLGYAFDRKVEIIFSPRPDTSPVQRFTYYLLRLNVNETMALQNIHFYRGSLRVTANSLPELTMLADFLAANPTWRIQLEGHVCCLGPGRDRDEPYDESTLSQKRAEVIRDSLVAHGIDPVRLRCVGLGNNNPITDEQTLEEQELNRRVEVRVLSK